MTRRPTLDSWLVSVVVVILTCSAILGFPKFQQPELVDSIVTLVLLFFFK